MSDEELKEALQEENESLKSSEESEVPIIQIEKSIEQDEIVSKRMGRPFIGVVANKTGIEKDIVERKSIMRAFKKCYGKDKYLKDPQI